MKKYRKDSDVSYALGTELTYELLKQKPKQVKCIYVHSKQIDNAIYQSIVSLCQQNGIEIIRQDKAFNILSDKANCYIIGEFTKYESKIDTNNNHVMLVNPANTGNLGTILRTSIGFGLKDIAIITPAVDVFEPKTIRASMGAVFNANIQLFSSFQQYREMIEDRPIYSFMLDGKVRLDQVEVPKKYTLVFGNEATGLPKEYQQYGTSVLIKHYQSIDSLNLCNAVSIALYEFTKGKIK